MSFVMIVTILLGFVVPPVVSFLKNSGWPKWKRIVLAGAVSVAAAAGHMFVQGDVTHYRDLLTNAAVVWAIATANYKLWFGNTDLNLKLEAMGFGDHSS